MFHRKDKENVYAEVVDDMYKHQIISEKTFDRITGWDKEKSPKTTKSKKTATKTQTISLEDADSKSVEIVTENVTPEISEPKIRVRKIRS